MARTFLYARVSTTEQKTENQLIEAQAAAIHPQTLLEKSITYM